MSSKNRRDAVKKAEKVVESNSLGNLPLGNKSGAVKQNEENAKRNNWWDALKWFFICLAILMILMTMTNIAKAREIVGVVNASWKVVTHDVDGNEIVGVRYAVWINGKVFDIVDGGAVVNGRIQYEFHTSDIPEDIKSNNDGYVFGVSSHYNGKYSPVVTYNEGGVPRIPENLILEYELKIVISN